jgi:hypothetical protein
MAAFRRQNKADNAKNEAKRALESPHIAALLLRYLPCVKRRSLFDILAPRNMAKHRADESRVSTRNKTENKSGVEYQ